MPVCEACEREREARSKVILYIENAWWYNGWIGDRQVWQYIQGDIAGYNCIAFNIFWLVADMINNMKII